MTPPSPRSCYGLTILGGNEGLASDTGLDPGYLTARFQKSLGLFRDGLAGILPAMIIAL
ncbi:MAG: hypothetical protein HPY82_00500 [Gammaproteobacteria bacterium]|nr:hypothetical protein [Gammaproteobacteria bacterium]